MVASKRAGARTGAGSTVLEGVVVGSLVPVVVVAESQVDCDAFVAAFRGDGRVRVAGAATTSEQSVRLARASLGCVAVVRLSGAAGLLVARSLRAAVPAVRLVVCGLADDPTELLPWVEVGVLGYVDRRASFDELVSAVLSAGEDEVTGSASLARALFRRTVRSPSERVSFGDQTAVLTRREDQVLELVAHGLTNKQVAVVLSIEPATVKNHVHSILRKLHLSSRAQAVTWFTGRNG
jgi:two-component system, NarL family, nitrate/nitrite response regulator NarL